MTHRDSSRGKRSYIWVTWIAGLLAGSDRCEWAAWYKSHFRYAKRPQEDGSSLEDWRHDHDAMVIARVCELQEAGFTVTVEDQNAFTLNGSVGTLAGKPDIVAVSPSTNIGRVIDEKSGDEKPAHAWQVRLYQFALPRVVSTLKHTPLVGSVEYRSHSIDTPILEPDESARLIETIQRVGGAQEPARQPSMSECAWCDILRCPDRIETKKYEGETAEW